ncbi:MAG: cob(I)yrinic acid a,c-diamide adenosyltransferase [Proteobacteria bacterium]|nr:cob(I)yrinic acid a,c-diamide adenosyltransferase [Desulfobacula sp.]MBU3951321.1 cob(I)yrinic acid a,c-diamide adenosyltransferase [Pseudomonadota bacterium]MBU4130366.1 cob(I)yrinic acid a,c-diamide adenosyltransferase [Pseudomonadota bacterium]
MEGYIQIYTGNGKGKTTSALGLAIRAVGAGKKVFIGQFLKSGKYSEMKALARFPDQITVEQFGLGKFVRGKPSEDDKKAGINGYKKIFEILTQGAHDLVIMDEGNVALYFGIITEQSLLDLFNAKPAHVELVVTGRGATPAIMERADLVVEMKEIKHYYQQGVKARIGIEK